VNPPSAISITADHREKISGIPGLLLQEHAEVTIKSLLTGDYLINERIIIERKSARDFVQSIINNRLFEQCARMRRDVFIPVLLMEGDPYNTNHKMSRRAILGALLSVKVAWQIPVIFAKNKEESVEILIMLGKQVGKKDTFIPYHNGYKPKRISNKRFQFLQGLPGIGPLLASRLYENFGNVRSVINASVKDLIKVHGVGAKLAQDIIDFNTN